MIPFLTLLSRCCRPPNLRAVAALVGALTLAHAASAQLGACCLPNGNCIANAADTQCQAAGGLFFPGGGCGRCDAIGACCVGVNCILVTPGQCLAQNGTYFGASTCGTSQCQPPPGACCNTATGVCTSTTQNACNFTWIFGVTCAAAPCAPTGACCSATGCSITIEDNCDSPGQTWFPNVGSCTAIICGQGGGSCCNPATGACQITTASGCPTPNIFTLGGNCNSQPCQAQGACCLATGCVLTVKADCAQLGGTFFANAPCSPNPCPGPRGACCAPVAGAAGGCIFVQQTQCPSGALFFPGQPCSPNNPCPPTTGACCLPTGCIIVPQGQCAPGYQFIPGQPCSATICPQIGACCTATAGCVPTTLNNCPGHWFPATPCSPDPCPQTGACCTLSGGCVQTAFTQCSGKWYANTPCTPNPCPRGGCCNKLTGQCFVTYRADCDHLGLNYLGNGVPCTPAKCKPLTGACCIPGSGVCFITTQARCTVGLWFPNKTCSPNPCCRADHNGDNNDSVQDIFDFLADWFTGCP